MPRLIPRLLRNLERTRSRHSVIPQKPVREATPKSPAEDASPIRAFTRPDEVDISYNSRSQSILLDRKVVRLIYRHARYQREKEPAPEVRVSRARWEAKQRRGRAPLGVIPRVMTEEERSFWANPYLRMLGSPLRKCYQSGLVLPRDLMIGMVPTLVPGVQRKFYFLPAGIEHPTFRRLKGGKTRYLLCWKRTLEIAQKTGLYRRWTPEQSEMTMHPLVAQQVGHALRVRVLQELQILARQLRRRGQPSAPPLLRRLTRTEWNEIKASGVVPFKNAVAVLVVPPTNRNPETKQRPQPNHTSLPTKEDVVPVAHLPQSRPLSVMYPTSKNESWKSVDEHQLLPSAQVPLYNGVPLFPSRTQRAALYAALTKVLNAERAARSKNASSNAHGNSRDIHGGASSRATGDQKASHAFVICSDEKTLFRGDTVPLAIALWRIRMWEAANENGLGIISWTTRPFRTQQ